MTREETLKILTIIKAAYPQFYKGMSRTEGEGVASLWASMLMDYPHTEVEAAVKRLLALDTKGYPPSIGQVIQSIAAAKRPEEDERTESDVWRLVSRAIANGLYNARSEWERLPEDVREVVDPTQLHDWAMLEDDVRETNIRAMVLRSWRERKERRDEMLSLPPSVRASLEALKPPVSLPEGEADRLPSPESNSAVWASRSVTEPYRESEAQRAFMAALRGLAKSMESDAVTDREDVDREARERTERMAREMGVRG